MEESLRLLSQQREWDGDDLLVAQVKIQLLVDELTRATWQSPEDGPPALYLAALQTQLDNIKSQLPQRLQKSSMPQLRYPAHFSLPR
jgi:hypothetical protein